ncbi:hypothetical protein I2483_13615 [Sporosarcina sp. E16_3]|uniref:hypothetical protein n=1 Tax=Sporosarcina sp. E16_3 TaxID=2789293 RepID=UPI001A91BB30|nr:hypothetical protein [Sporosarcina sp. E16_3]MBO0602700.1 hypothetical protein [Sporosarcina sp. E16_3]
MSVHQHGLNRSLIMHLREAFTEAKVDLVYDGYKFPADRPLITLETMQANNRVLAKGRESVEVIYRYQVGLHDVNSVQLSINQERLTQVFNFDDIPYYDTLQTPSVQEGFFNCVLRAVVPMPASDVSVRTGYHRVYFDVEITDVKRR